MALSSVLEHMLISRRAFVYRTVNPPLCVVYHDNIFEGRYQLGLKIQPSQIWYEVCEERYVRSRVFAWEVRLGSNDEVAGLEVVKGGKDLRSIESWVQWHQYSAQLEERICGLRQVSLGRCTLRSWLTVANSTLLPNDTATLSPFFTPLFCKPLASALDSRSSTSYVRIVRWWCEMTLLVLN